MNQNEGVGEDNQAPPNDFLQAFDQLAHQYGMKRAALLRKAGLKNRSITTYWANGNRPTEAICLKIALVEQRLKNLTEEVLAEIAKNWLVLGGRFDQIRHGTTDKLFELLNIQRSEQKPTVRCTSWQRQLLDTLSDQKDIRHTNEILTCLYAQSACRMQRENWLKNEPNTQKEVLHLHYWKPHASGDVFDSTDIEEQFTTLLQNKIPVGLLILYPEWAAEPLAFPIPKVNINPREREQRQKLYDSLEKLAQNYPKHFSVYQARNTKKEEYNGDLWLFEASHKNTYALQVFTPVGISEAVQPLMQNMEDAQRGMYSVTATPILMDVLECYKQLRIRGIEQVKGGPIFRQTSLGLDKTEVEIENQPLIWSQAFFSEKAQEGEK